MSQFVKETLTAIQRTVHNGYHEHRIQYSESILLFPMRNYFLKVINNILSINEVWSMAMIPAFLPVYRHIPLRTGGAGRQPGPQLHFPIILT